MIYIIDAPCGEGKTTAAINMINSTSASGQKYLYITPFLTEVQRIKTVCHNFFEPQQMKNKMNGMKWLLGEHRNIVSTHALFLDFDEHMIEMIKSGEYILILDEVAEVVEIKDDIKPNDIQTVLNNFAHIEDGLLIWDAEDYDGRYNDIMTWSKNRCCGIYGDKAIVWCFPTEIFKAFKDVYILTYMFNAQIQRYYYDFYNIQYTNLYVKDMQITTEKQVYKVDVKNKINILDNYKMNKIGETPTALSVSWYRRDADQGHKLMKILQANLLNYFGNITKSPSDLNMWTTYLKYKKKITGKGYSKGFVQVGARATNDFRHKKYLANCTNIYVNPVLDNFFKQKNIIIDSDAYALSEIIQWIWRSAIRDDKEIEIYLPSSRMQSILNTWIDSNY